MHFPPAGDDEEIMVPDSEDYQSTSNVMNEGSETPSGMGSTLSVWAEQAQRSDRMSWSLIGLSHALAHELGIFGTYADGMRSADSKMRKRRGSVSYQNRAERIERLLYIYVTQACGRFGFPSLYSDQVNRINLKTAGIGQDFGRRFLPCPSSAIGLCSSTDTSPRNPEP